MESKVFNDPIHGLIELHPLLVKIIDTPEFQRLRNIKQLGMCYSVYPGASHNRFEHSIGVCFLAGRLVKELKAKDVNSELGITDEDVLCVQIAGLCHDLGHGPLSHMFDKMFVKRVLKEFEGDETAKEYAEKRKKFVEHEERSRLILEHLISKNQLIEHFKKYKLDKDIGFIGELITAGDRGTEEIWPFKGRTEEKSFLYEIVANERNGIDVDKWDYFARDCHMLGIKNDFDHNRCIQVARVIKVEGRRQICYRDKEVYNLYEMFHTRFNLHVRAYQHHTNKIIEHEVAEALWKARNDINVSINGKTLSDIVRTADIEAFCYLSDDVMSEIWKRGTPEAKACLMKIYMRQQPKLVSEVSLTASEKGTMANLERLRATLTLVIHTGVFIITSSAAAPLHDFVEKYMKAMGGVGVAKFKANLERLRATLTLVIHTGVYIITSSAAAPLHDFVEKYMKAMDGVGGAKFKGPLDDLKTELTKGMDLNDEEITVLEIGLNYGKKDKNPMEYVHFYKKGNPNEAFKINKDWVSRLLPSEFSETKLRVYGSKQKLFPEIRRRFSEWCEKKGYHLPPTSGDRA